MTLFRSLKNRPFALLWTGQTISRVGDHLYQIALAWWVLQKTGSATAMGAVMICAFTPMLIFLLIGGVAVDRFNRVAVMLMSDIGRGVLVLGVAALAFAGQLEIWQLYAASLLFGFVDAFFNPAYAAALPSLVSKDDLPSANSLSSLSQQLGRVVGPAIGAALVGAAGTGWAFAINGASFFVSAAFLLPLMRRPQLVMSGDITTGSTPPTIVTDPVDVPESPQRSSVWRDVRDGIGFVLSTPWLWTTVVMFTLTNVLLAGPYSVALPFLVKEDMGHGVGALGFLYAMFPVGYAISALALGNATRMRRRGMMIYLGATLGGAMILVFGLKPSIALLAVAALVNGFALEAAQLAWTNVLQERVPAAMLGRVYSIDSLGSFALLPVGYALAGWATDHIGAPMVFLIGGGATTIIAAAGLLHPSVRRLD